MRRCWIGRNPGAAGPWKTWSIISCSAPPAPARARRRYLWRPWRAADPDCRSSLCVSRMAVGLPLLGRYAQDESTSDSQDGVSQSAAKAAWPFPNRIFAGRGNAAEAAVGHARNDVGGRTAASQADRSASSGLCWTAHGHLPPVGKRWERSSERPLHFLNCRMAVSTVASQSFMTVEQGAVAASKYSPCVRPAPRSRIDEFGSRGGVQP